MSTAKDEKLLAALVASATIREAAERVGLSVRRVQQRLAEPEFYSRYRKACEDALRAATADLQRISSDAVWNLHEVADDQRQPAAARVAAAKGILEYSLKMTEQADLLERIEALEQRKERKT